MGKAMGNRTKRAAATYGMLFLTCFLLYFLLQAQLTQTLGPVFGQVAAGAASATVAVIGSVTSRALLGRKIEE